MHYDGSTWTTVDNPEHGADANLSAVWGSSADDIFAAGDGGMILHYSGN
jgi:hypothetical protein